MANIALHWTSFPLRKGAACLSNSSTSHTHTPRLVIGRPLVWSLHLNVAALWLTSWLETAHSCVTKCLTASVLRFAELLKTRSIIAGSTATDTACGPHGIAQTLVEKQKKDTKKKAQWGMAIVIEQKAQILYTHKVVLKQPPSHSKRPIVGTTTDFRHRLHQSIRQGNYGIRNGQAMM